MQKPNKLKAKDRNANMFNHKLQTYREGKRLQCLQSNKHESDIDLQLRI